MSTTYKIGGTDYTVRPRTLRLEQELSATGGVRDELRAIARDETALTIERQRAQAKIDAIDIGALTDKAIVKLTDDIEALEVRQNALNWRGMEASIKVAHQLLRDSDGGSPSLDDLSDTDLDLITAILAVVTGPPTTTTSDEE
jgi:hypothetical protein